MSRPLRLEASSQPPPPHPPLCLGPQLLSATAPASLTLEMGTSGVLGGCGVIKARPTTAQPVLQPHPPGKRTRECHRAPTCRAALAREREQEATCAPLYMPDGIHTSANGSDAIAEGVAAALRRCAKRTAGSA